ncbi:hypothetical protein IKG06_02305 [Candidatus Saccharibacteria bacterium]|nr:hypothetical protein [Candidatus Saccharibacteria bacterium]
MFEKHRRIRICRAINTYSLVPGAILSWVAKPLTPLHCVIIAIVFLASLNLCVIDKSKKWSILYLIIAILALASLLVELILTNLPPR